MKKFFVIIVTFIAVSGCAFSPAYTLGDYLGTEISDQSMIKRKEILISRVQMLIDSGLFTYEEIIIELDTKIIRGEKQ
ncbi:hypothetical protein KAR91_62640 [Candidatus Pacearchaeota archaeon]|nr:hypothetical protein [Candidatus Pacearchaeota archaeon]